MTNRVDRDEVLRWMVANDATTVAASRHFQISDNTIKSWVRRARLALPPDRTPPKGAVSNLVALPTPPVVKVALPPDLRTQAETAVRLRMDRLCDPKLIASETSKDLRDGIRVLVDSYELFGNMTRPVEDDLSTAEGRAKALAELEKLPLPLQKRIGVADAQ